ncbi:MAG: DapH/DapD/GlmU-related protein [Planctomycetota bacterium]
MTEAIDKPEPGVIIGYPTGRKIADRSVSIGPGAVLRSNTVVYEGVRIGKGLQTGHNVVIREENTIGDETSIWSNSVVDYGCRIGSHVRIHTNVYICQYSTIEDDAFIAPGVSFANDPYPVQNKVLKGPTVKKGARVGLNATLLPGVTIGENAVIGAGSVVTKDVPPARLWFGNPAKDHGPIQALKDEKGNAVYDAQGRRLQK